MEVAIAHPDQLIHVRTVLGVVMGLSVARLLTGLARLIQHPGRVRLYPTHLIWAAFLFLGVVYFWWFEFGLQHVAQWSFELYFFLIFYAALFFLQCTLLFPDHMEEYSGFEAYFHSRQKWFYGLLAALAIVDVMDTLWKGIEHFHAIGHWYMLRQGVMVLAALAAMFIAGRRFHFVFAVCSVAGLLCWILLRYQYLR